MIVCNIVSKPDRVQISQLTAEALERMGIIYLVREFREPMGLTEITVREYEKQP